MRRISPTSVAIPPALKRAVMAKAASEGRTMTDVILDGLREYVGERTVYDHLPLRGDCARSSTMDRCPQPARPGSLWCSAECEAKDREIGERWVNLSASSRERSDDRWCDKPVGNGWCQLSPGHEGDCGLPGPAS